MFTVHRKEEKYSTNISWNDFFDTVEDIYDLVHDESWKKLDRSKVKDYYTKKTPDWIYKETDEIFIFLLDYEKNVLFETNIKDKEQIEYMLDNYFI